MDQILYGHQDMNYAVFVTSAAIERGRLRMAHSSFNEHPRAGEELLHKFAPDLYRLHPKSESWFKRYYYASSWNNFKVRSFCLKHLSGDELVGRADLVILTLLNKSKVARTAVLQELVSEHLRKTPGDVPIRPEQWKFLKTTAREPPTATFVVKRDGKSKKIKTSWDGLVSIPMETRKPRQMSNQDQVMYFAKRFRAFELALGTNAEQKMKACIQDYGVLRDEDKRVAERPNVLKTVFTKGSKGILKKLKISFVKQLALRKFIELKPGQNNFKPVIELVTSRNGKSVTYRVDLRKNEWDFKCLSSIDSLTPNDEKEMMNDALRDVIESA